MDEIVLCLCERQVIEEGYHDSPCYCKCHPGFIETDPSR